MTDTPTREQVQKALDWQERGDQPDRLIDGINPILIIQTAARAWLEMTEMTKEEWAQLQVAMIQAHRIDEAMIERAAKAIDRDGWEIFGEGDGRGIRMRESRDLAERVLRAALEVAVDMPELSIMPSADEGTSAYPRWRKGNYR